MLLPKLLLLAAVRAKDPTATELREYADLFRCGPVKLGDRLATVKASQCGDSLCTQKASPQSACAKRCARTRHCGAVAYGDEECTLYRTGALNGSTSNACVASYRKTARPTTGEVLHRFAPGLAYRFFSVVDLKEKVYLLARDGLWPNAAPDERLLLWVTNEKLELTSEPAEVRLPLPEGVEERPAHNFAAIIRDGRVHGFGGRARGGTVLPRDFQRRGVHYFPPSHQPLTFETGSIRITGRHAGCQELRRTPVTCEWDGKLSAALFGSGVALFGRLNTAHGRRWVQVAVSNEIEGAFSAFEPIRITGWNGCRVRRASIYYIVVEKNPVDTNTLIGLFPMHEERRCYLALSFSCDAVHWSTPKPLIDLGCSREAGRVRDYPADGLVVRDDVVYYYIHQDMPTSNLVVNQDIPRDGSALVRHALDINWLRNASRDALVDLGGSMTCEAALKDITAPFRGAVFDEAKGIHQDRLPQCTREDRLAHVAEVQKSAEEVRRERARLEDKFRNNHVTL